MEIVRIVSELQRVYREQGLYGLRAKLGDKFFSLREARKYQEFVSRNRLTEEGRTELRRLCEGMSYEPLISVLLPVYNVDEKWLRLCIDSVRRQLYPNWELCIADDASTRPYIKQVLEEYAAADDRVKVVFRTENGHISAASNSALELVTGAFVALLDHDDELSEEALFWIAREINDHPTAQLIYSDEDLIDEKGRRYWPKFKPDWSPDLFLSLNLVTHLLVFRTDLVRAVGGFRIGFEGSQDYDLTLRCVERIAAADVRHVSRVLYHWRAIRGSVALSGNEKPYAHDRAREAIRTHLQRTGRRADVTEGDHNLHRVRFELPAELPRTSIIFVEDCDPDVFRRSVTEMIDQTDYPGLEVIVASRSRDQRNLQRQNIRYLNVDTEATAEVLNLAASISTGLVLCFAEVRFRPLSSNWLREMLGWAIQSDIGAVGAKLLNNNWTVIHGGLITGVEGGVGIAHRGMGREAVGNMFRNRFPGNFSATSVSFMMIEKEKFQQIGGFDSENFPKQLFDVDLCLRLRAGEHRIVVTPFAELIHTSKSTPKSFTETPSAAERMNFERRWPGYLRFDPFYNPNLSKKKADFSIDI